MSDMTRHFSHFQVLNTRIGKTTLHPYIKGRKSTQVELEAFASLRQQDSSGHWIVNGFKRRGEPVNNEFAGVGL